MRFIDTAETGPFEKRPGWSGRIFNSSGKAIVVYNRRAGTPAYSAAMDVGSGRKSIGGAAAAAATARSRSWSM